MSDMETGRPQVVPEFSTRTTRRGREHHGICPAALGTKDQQPSAYSPRTPDSLRADQPRLHGL